MLSFYLFEHVFILCHCSWEDFNCEYRLLGWCLFSISHWSYSTDFWLPMLLLKSQSPVELSFLFSLAAFTIFPLSLIFCNFIIRYLSIDLFLSFLSFIEIPEYEDQCLLVLEISQPILTHQMWLLENLFSPYLLNRHILDLLTLFFISLNYSSSCSISLALQTIL